MKWVVYIPDDGHWDIPYNGGDKREAARAAVKMFRHAFGNAWGKRLPRGSFVSKELGA